jgi:hypothetical protein
MSGSNPPIGWNIPVLSAVEASGSARANFSLDASAMGWVMFMRSSSKRQRFQDMESKYCLMKLSMYAECGKGKGFAQATSPVGFDRRREGD